MGKRRLDALLAERGLFPSRSRAAASVMAGEVRVGPGARRAAKPREIVDCRELLAVEGPAAFVSRGGIKLANALAGLELEVSGRCALDVGASTGGFTDCLLQHGAREVIALDVAYGSFDWSIRNDPRVHVIERTNARALVPSMLPFAPDLAVLDVSFISLAQVLPAVLACLAPGYDALALVKPQFELGRARVGKGGVVRGAADRRDALVAVGRSALEAGAAVLGYRSSGLPGPKGNRETFIWLGDPAAAARGVERGSGSARTLMPSTAPERADAQALEALAREVEP